MRTAGCRVSTGQGGGIFVRQAQVLDRPGSSGTRVVGDVKQARGSGGRNGNAEAVEGSGEAAAGSLKIGLLAGPAGVKGLGTDGLRVSEYLGCFFGAEEAAG